MATELTSAPCVPPVQRPVREYRAHLLDPPHALGLPAPPPARVQVCRVVVEEEEAPHRSPGTGLQRGEDRVVGLERTDLVGGYHRVEPGRDSALDVHAPMEGVRVAEHGGGEAMATHAVDHLAGARVRADAPRVEGVEEGVVVNVVAEHRRRSTREGARVELARFEPPRLRVRDDEPPPRVRVQAGREEGQERRLVEVDKDAAEVEDDRVDAGHDWRRSGSEWTGVTPGEQASESTCGGR